MTHEHSCLRLTNITHLAGRVALLAALALCCLSPGLVAGPELDPLEQQTLLDMKSVLFSIEAYKIDNNAVPGPTDGMVTAEFLLPFVEPVYIRELSVNDGWGNPLGYWSDGQRFIVASFGSDGNPEREYAGAVDLQDCGDDIVALDGELAAVPPHLLRMMQAGKQKMTMADMRSIATSVEAYKIDNDVCPGSTPGQVEVVWMQEMVQPIYIRNLPLTDGWGRPFLYWCDGEHYRIASLGMDGVQDRPFDLIEPETGTQTFNSDIVFEDGRFIQYPEGEQH
jgi:hypothetical protein